MALEFGSEEEFFSGKEKRRSDPERHSVAQGQRRFRAWILEELAHAELKPSRFHFLVVILHQGCRRRCADRPWANASAVQTGGGHQIFVQVVAHGLLVDVEAAVKEGTRG